MNRDKSEKLSLEHTGDHHQAKIIVDPDTKKVFGGIVHNFSNNSAVRLSLNEQGKVTGTILHSGDTHGFRTDVKSDGSFQGIYVDRERGIELTLSGGEATLTKGKIPQAGLKIKGDHHRTLLKFGDNGKISGVIESRVTKDGAFGIQIQDGKITGGSFVHKGKHHKTKISVGQDGWKAGISAGTSKSKWSISVENGKAETTIFGGLKLKF